MLEMLVGYNNNVTYKGKVYHVQTEDSGLKNPVIVTLLYFKGSILASKKTDYSHLLDSSNLKMSVRELMKEQHKAMLKELIAGKYSGEDNAVVESQKKEDKIIIESASVSKSPKPEAREHKEQTLDDILLDYIIQKEKK